MTIQFIESKVIGGGITVGTSIGGFTVFSVTTPFADLQVGDTLIAFVISGENVTITDPTAASPDNWTKLIDIRHPLVLPETTDRSYLKVFRHDVVGGEGSIVFALDDLYNYGTAGARHDLTATCAILQYRGMGPMVATANIQHSFPSDVAALATSLGATVPVIDGDTLVLHMCAYNYGMSGTGITVRAEEVSLPTSIAVGESTYSASGTSTAAINAANGSRHEEHTIAMLFAVPFQMSFAYAVSTNEVLVKFTRAPQDTSAFLTGDVRNPSSWAVTVPATGQVFSIAGVTKRDEDDDTEWVVRLLEKLPPSTATCTLTTTVKASTGEVIS